QVGDVRGLAVGDGFALVDDRAFRGRQESGQQVEYGGLAGAVGADHGVDGARLNLKIDLVDGDESLEFLAQTPCFQNVVTHRQLSPVRTVATSSMYPMLLFSAVELAARPGLFQVIQLVMSW